MSKKIIIIGAGLGGLAAAVRLAKEGFAVTVLEKNANVGGKVNIVEANGYSFDTGASLLTMRHVLDELFAVVGRRTEDFLELVLLEPITRYFWSDGTIFDASRNQPRTEKNIAVLEPQDVAGFRRFIKDARTKYEISEKTFLAHSLNDLPKLLRPKYAGDLARISSWRTLDSHVRNHFKSEKLQQLFNRFATYNGSSPYLTPATFALIGYVEFALGGWYVKGGMYRIPKALAQVAEELGVEFRFNSEVEKIIVENKKAVGVKLKNGDILKADFVIANADAVETYRNLLSENERPSYSNGKLEKIEPSCSGFVLLLGVKKQFPHLAHHNIFFADDYKREFDEIFKEKRPAGTPTIYVCAATRTDETQAPPACENLFVLVNAPYTNEKTDWQKETRSYRNLIIKSLEKFGLEDLEKNIEFEQVITPADFAQKYRANKGSIYGVSSNSLFSAFLRPPNRAKDIKNLYFASGSTHPGGGIPIVLLSGKMAADLISRQK